MILSFEEKSKLLELAWQENKPFQTIEQQFGLSEGQVTLLMNKYLKSNNYKRWRDKVTGQITNH